ncbi:MAG: copper chaperone PCu(A)C [Anaerolineae bacterium]|nr:copper chaperone PCu(A)C [Anaerolineae bacterium]
MRKFILSLIMVVCLSLTAAPYFASAHEGGPHVRLVHLAKGVAEVDVYFNHQKVAEAAAYGVTTPYLPVEGYELMVSFVPHGGKMEEALNKDPFKFTFKEGDGGYYTLVTLMGEALEVVMLPADGAPVEAMSHEGHEGDMGTPASGEAAEGNLKISGGFARATTSGMSGHSGMGAMGKVSAAYMMIMNSGGTPDKLIKVEGSADAVYELHESKIENDVAKMVPVEGGIEVPANGMVELKPGGLHIMMMDLKGDLAPGDTLTLTLTFESGTVITVDVPVKQP